MSKMMHDRAIVTIEH